MKEAEHWLFKSAYLIVLYYFDIDSDLWGNGEL